MAFDVAEWVDANLTRARPSAGDEWTAECPFCEVFGGFYVNCAEDGKGPWVCFKCGERSRTIVRLVAHVEDLNPAEARAMVMRDAMEFRRKESPVTLLERIRGLRESDDLSDLDLLSDDDGSDTELPREFIPVWDGKRWRVPTYMTKRKFKRATLRAWGVGFCQSGYFHHRVIIPLDCPNGRSFTARALEADVEPRYLNPPGADHAKLLFGWKHSPIHSDFCLAEGPLDAMKLWQHGLPAMAFGGKVLSSHQLGMLFTRPSGASVCVMLDPEAQVEALDVASQLVTHFEYVYVAKLPDGVDPGASTKAIAMRAHAKATRYTGARGARTLLAVENARRKLAERYKK